VLGVPLDEQLDIAMANAVDDIVAHRRMARRLTGIATVSRRARHCPIPLRRPAALGHHQLQGVVIT
jgi:hypothetical protein